VRLPVEAHGGVELPEGCFDPVGTAENRRFARDDPRANLLGLGNQCGGDVARAEIFGEGGGNLPRDDVVRDLF
jgi:hypothetical protein